MAQVECGAGPGARHHRRRHGLRRAAGARDAHRAPQHRQALRGPGRVRGDEADRERREPSLPLLPRPRDRRARARPVGDGVRDRASGPHVRDAGHRDHRLRATRARDRTRRHLRLLGAPRADPRARRAAALERRSARGPDARSRSSARRARHPHRAHRRRPAAAWRTGAPRPTRSRSPRVSDVVACRNARRSGCYALRRRLLWPPPLRALPLLRRGPRVCGPRRPPGRPERSGSRVRGGSVPLPALRQPDARCRSRPAAGAATSPSMPAARCSRLASRA